MKKPAAAHDPWLGHPVPVRRGDILSPLPQWLARLAPGRPRSILLLATLLLLTLPTQANQILIVLRVIEVPHTTLTTLLADPIVQGDALHTQALALAREGKAQIIDTHAISAPSGRKATVESISEMIYPTEYEPSIFPGFAEDLNQNLFQPTNSRPPPIASFETRNTGPTLEIEPALSAEGLIDLRFVWDHCKFDGLVTWHQYRDEFGDGSTHMPIFITQRVNTSVTLLDGTYQLAHIQNPTPAAIPEAPTRRLVFIGAHVLQHPTP